MTSKSNWETNLINGALSGFTLYQNYKTGVPTQPFIPTGYTHGKISTPQQSQLSTVFSTNTQTTTLGPAVKTSSIATGPAVAKGPVTIGLNGNIISNTTLGPAAQQSGHFEPMFNTKSAILNDVLTVGVKNFNGTTVDYQKAGGQLLSKHFTGFSPTSFEYRQNQDLTAASKYGAAGMLGGHAANMIFGKKGQPSFTTSGAKVDTTRIDPITGKPLIYAAGSIEERKAYAAFEEYKRKSAEQGVAIINGPSQGPKNAYYQNGKWYTNAKNRDKEVKGKGSGWTPPGAGKAVKNVAKTTFETGPNSKLATPDYYADPAVNPVNAIQGNSANYDSNETIARKQEAAASSQGMLLGSMGGLSDKYKGFTPTALANINYADTWDKLKKVYKNPSEFNRLFGKDFVKGFLTQMGYTGDLEKAANFLTTKPTILSKAKNRFGIGRKSSVDSDISGTKLIFANGSADVPEDQLDKYIGMNYLLGELTGDNALMRIMDMGIHLSVLLAILREGIIDRVPEIIAKALEQAPTDEDRRKLRLAGVWIAAEHSYLDYIIETASMKDIGVGAIMASIPELVGLLLENFKFFKKDEYSNNDYSLKLVNLLFELEPNWMSYDRNGTKVTNIENMGWITDDAKWALQADPRTELVAVLAKAHPPIDAIRFTLERREFAPVNRTMW